MTADLDSQSDSVLPPPSRPAASGALGRGRFDNGPVPLAMLGRYTVLGQIAGGGMGSVHLALMRGPAAFSRLVAIKCLHMRWVDDPKYVARFATEVRLTTRIRHPNVVEALDVVEEGGELFLVMEYVDGVTLAALLADLRRLGRLLPVELAAGALAAVLRGLHAAHETTDEHGVRLDIVHRDVSPQNIMVSRAGHVQVLDFGAAKALDHSQHTAAGVLVGKLAYMAPEQVHGEGSSPRTDVFAAGVVLWEALAGKRLFYDPSLQRSELLSALARKPIMRPSLLRPDVPRALDVVVKKALHRDPGQRYQNALELAEALEVFAAGASGGRLAALVREACAQRLAEKDELLRVGMAALEQEPSVSTPVPSAPPVSHGALLVPAAQHTLPGLVLRREPRPTQASRWPWLVAVLAGAAALGGWCGGLRLSFEPRSPARPLAPPAEHSAVLRLGVDPATRADGAAAAAAPSSAGPSRPTSLTGPADDASGSASAGATRGPVRAARGARPPLAQATDPGEGVWERAAVAAGARPKASAAPRPRARERDACEPPTYMDAAGIRHFKKGCL